MVGAMTGCTGPRVATGLTAQQLEVLQHSLGLDEYGRGPAYRKHYVGESQTCRELVAIGYMREYPASELTGGDPLFLVTVEGLEATRRESPTPPKLTRSQVRYRRFLDADCGLRFGEWIRLREAR